MYLYVFLCMNFMGLALVILHSTIEVASSCRWKSGVAGMLEPCTAAVLQESLHLDSKTDCNPAGWSLI